MTHTTNSGTTESSGSHQLTVDEHPSSDDDVWEFVPTKPPKARLPNHVIGSLERKYFPGLAKPNDDDPTLPGLTWEHYQHTKDEHSVTMAAWVIDDSHEAFSCVDGEKDKATKSLVKSDRKILSDIKHTLRYKAVM
ncbi:Glutamate decarboxylase 1 [Hordeum vulgare]|nr:Glutamate decarboxylase 1 [Hordeum vulgare]